MQQTVIQESTKIPEIPGRGRIGGYHLQDLSYLKVHQFITNQHQWLRTTQISCVNGYIMLGQRHQSTLSVPSVLLPSP
ncbi:uncharacterized protein METZ01_LOCUS394920 [marine metagenome]|uniref:Uncharacterized protein n=1 Tax=marine metagenome TaxID=408172 RepID=A0A382V665_9ZZZZ